MRIIGKQESFHGFTSNKVQLLEDALKFRVDALCGGTTFSRFLIPFVALFKMPQLHMHSTKQSAGTVALWHQCMCLLTHFYCF